MASGGLPHQPLQAAFLAHSGKDSFAQGYAGLLDSRGTATASALPPPEIHPRHVVPDERDAFISWLRGEFAAANAIIDALCHHLRMIGEPSEYDFLLTCIQQRRYNWTLVLHMQQFFSVAEISYALQQATWRRQQARNLHQPYMPHGSMEDVKDPRVLDVLRGLKVESPNIITQTNVSVGDKPVALSRDVSISDLSITQDLYNGLRLQSPVAMLKDLEASRSLSKTALDPSEQSAIQVSSPIQTVIMSPEGQEMVIDPETKTSVVAPKPPGPFGGKSFGTEFTALSKEEKDSRLPMIKMSKHFQCWEHVDGNLVNVAEGLELYENVLNSHEASQVASLITEMQSAGRQGEFGGKTFVVEKRLAGAPKEVLQFCSNDKCSGDLADPMPLVFTSLIDRLILWHILPPSKRPDYCSIEILEEGEDCPFFLSYQHVDQYFCCLFLMAESTMVFGHKLLLNSGDYKSRFKLLLPSGSALVIQGKSAEIASRAVVKTPGKRIMVTFAKVLGDKVMDVLSSGGKIPPTHTLASSSALASSAALTTWPTFGLPGGGPPVVHSLMPAMMKHIGMANASGVLPIPPSIRPFPQGPHPIPQHLVTAPGNVPAVVPGGSARTFPPMGVFGPTGWPAVPPRAPPRPPNSGTGVFFPSGGSGNAGRPLQIQSGMVMMSPQLPNSEPLVPFVQVPTSELQPNRNQWPISTSTEQTNLVERGDSGSWHPSSGASSTEPVSTRKAARKESAYSGPKSKGNVVKEEQQQRGLHRSNKAGGGKI